VKARHAIPGLHHVAVEVPQVARNHGRRRGGEGGAERGEPRTAAGAVGVADRRRRGLESYGRGPVVVVLLMVVVLGLTVVSVVGGGSVVVVVLCVVVDDGHVAYWLMKKGL
jgi:hypothetical protein